MILNELKNINSSKSDLRKFGIGTGCTIVIIALLLMIFEKDFYQYFFYIGGILVLTGLIAPIILLPVQKIWMGFAVIMGYIVSRIILILLYFLVFTSIGIILRLSGKDFLDRKLKSDLKTYWNPVKSKQGNIKKGLLKQF